MIEKMTEEDVIEECNKGNASNKQEGEGLAEGQLDDDLEVRLRLPLYLLLLLLLLLMMLLTLTLMLVNHGNIHAITCVMRAHMQHGHLQSCPVRELWSW